MGCTYIHVGIQREKKILKWYHIILPYTLYSVSFKTIFQKEIAGNHDRAINQNGNRSFCFLIFTSNLGGFVSCELCTFGAQHVKLITQKNAA